MRFHVVTLAASIKQPKNGNALATRFCYLATLWRPDPLVACSSRAGRIPREAAESVALRFGFKTFAGQELWDRDVLAGLKEDP